MAGKKRHQKKKSPAAVSDEIDEQDLDRFAGSSDEDEETSNQPTGAKQQSPSTQPTKDDDDDGDDKDKGKENDEYDSEDDDFDHYDKQQLVVRQKQHGPAGMADAMAKILGLTAAGSKPSATTTSTTPVVLSKTVTPLQKQLLQEKEAAKKALVEKRRRGMPGTHPLPALHLPLSVATSTVASLMATQSSRSSGVAKELEQERIHRRVATRGVVALFNAVAQHQQQSKQQQQQTKLASSENSKDMKKKMTKHGFLDMIKTAAVENTTTNNNNQSENGHPKQPNESGQKSTSKWAAVQDDYLLNPKKVRASLCVG